MVRVARGVSDPSTAWRVRDALACHPLLGGATAQLEISASSEMVILEGWTLDATVERLAVHLARRAAGRRPVSVRIQHCHRERV